MAVLYIYVFETTNYATEYGKHLLFIEKEKDVFLDQEAKWC